jgi:uncharacterized membrane protein
MADSEHVGVHGDGGLHAQFVQHHAGRLAAHPGQGLHGFPLQGHGPAVPLQQLLRQRDHVLRLGVEQADAFDEGRQSLDAEGGHGGRCGRSLEQRARGLVHGYVGGLGRQHHGDEQGEGVDILQLRLRRGLERFETAEDFRHAGIADSGDGDGRLRHRAGWRAGAERRIGGGVSTAALYMDATITPNRSLSRRGFKLLMGVLIAVNLFSAVMFWRMGAIPVPIFLGADVLAVFVAFQVSFRAARLSERVQVSAEEIRVRYEAPNAGRTVWTSPTAFTGVSLEDIGAHGSRVRLLLSGRKLTVGAALSPKERVAFGRALEAAVQRARSERWRA